MLFELVGTPLRRLLARALVLGVLIIGLSFSLMTPVSAAVGINKQLNFQGRLLNAQGAVAADGFYNVQFKIYQDGLGTAAGNPGGTLKWTEDWLNNAGNGVKVVNGYISVQLGSITPFGSSIDWNQDTLWLSVNIGNTNTTCTPFGSCGGDGEMIPMKRLSAVPYALNASQLGGMDATGFIQNRTTLQAANIAVQSSAAGNVGVLIQGASGQTADLMDLRNGGGTLVASVSATGSVALQPSTDSTTAFTLKNSTGSSVLTADTQNARLGIGTNTPTTTLHIESNDALSNRLQTIIKQTGSGDAGIEMNASGTSYYVGIDNSDGGAFKINSNAAAGGAGPVGTSTIGSGPDTGAYNSYTYAKITPATNGTISQIKAYIGNAATAPLNKAVVGIYSTSGGGSPLTLLASSPETTLTGSSWNTFTLSSPLSVTGGVDYIIAYSANGSAGDNNNNLYYSTGAPASTSGYYSPRTYSTTLPTNASVWTSTSVYYSLYAVLDTGTPGDQFSAALFRMSSTGQTVFKNSANTTSSFQVQNAAGIGIFNVDTTNTRVGINLAASETAAYDLTFGGGADRYLGINQRTTAGTGRTLTVQGGQGNAGAGGALVLQGGAGNGTDQAGGAVNISGGTATGTGAVGVVNIQTSLNGNVVIGNASNAANTVTLAAGATNGINLLSDKIMVGNATTATTIQKTAQTAANQPGQTLTIQGASGQGSGNGGAVTIQGGNGGATGLYGGNLTLAGGTGTTSNGLVVLATSAFQTATTDAGCFPGGAESTTTTNCTIAQSSINNNASVIVGFTNDGQTAFMPDPSILTAGRVVYVTASNLTKDFTLSVNGGGQGNQIAMRKNTTATMIWNGTDWTAAGASSSTTLQAAYDNTLQSAGGAELVVSKTSATNGLTIRDSSVSPVNGTLLSVQTKSAAGLFQVNSNVTEYVSNAGAETSGASASTFPVSTWSGVGSATVNRYTTAGSNIATGQGSVSIATTAAAQDGVKNTLVSALTPAQTYNVSFAARLGSGTFNDLNVYYSVDGTATSVACTAAQTIATSVWTKVNCAFTAPSSGITAANAILIRQTSGTARIFYVDNLSVTIAADYNYATDGGASDSTNFATNWSAVSGSTVTRTTTAGNDASDSAQVVTTATAGQGARNKLSINPLTSTLYRITVYAASSNAFTDFTVRYSRDGGTNFAACADYNTQNISTSTSTFTKVTCYITTDATAATNPYVYFTQAGGTARTFYVDTFSMNLSSATTPNVQIGGGTNGGPTTLFTLDRGASAPIASNNDALLGSMYYDTTLGKLQCYEADGWGACGSSPDNIITISPEYTNAVLHGTGIGTMTSDLCSDYLDINDPTNGPAICGAGETYNFYKWTSPQASDQKYSIYVTYQLPTTFKGFNSGQTSVQARVDNATNAYVKLQIYKNHSGLTPCGTDNLITSTANTWQSPIASGTADPSTCGFAPGDSIVFKITVGAKSNASAYVGNLNFAFSNK